MLRFSSRSLSVLSNLLNHKAHVIINQRNCTALVKLPHIFIQNACYSADTKTKTTIGSLLSNAKDVKETTNPDPFDEEEAKKQREKSWKTMKLTLAFFGVSFTCLGGYLIFTLGAPERDEDGDVVKDDFSHMHPVKQYVLRTLRELDYYRRLIKEPSREKLLPDSLEYPYVQPKYTLVLEVTDVLVHPEWTYKTGWRFKKRPLLDYFLESLQGSYEIIIYTAEQGMTVFPLIEAIDPKNLIAYKLVRDATHFSGGHHVKSLNNLNRDLRKVICVDWNPKSVKFNPENLFRIKRWQGEDHDTSLLDLVSFLKAIADNEIEDVREVLANYSKYEDPILAFREKQKRLIDELEAQAAAKRELEKSKVSRWTPSFFKKSY